jgi:hypothetical protein
MSYTISTPAHPIWTWLSEITIGLQFGTALIGFCLTAALVLTRLRRRRRAYQVRYPCPGADQQHETKTRAPFRSQGCPRTAR